MASLLEAMDVPFHSLAERSVPAAAGAGQTAGVAPGGGISIIVPCWRDDAVTEELAAAWLRQDGVREVVVAAACGGAVSAGGDKRVKHVHCARAGRGHQMNEAARHAAGGVLLFQHCDTVLTEEHLSRLAAAMREGGVVGGAFRRRFDERHPHLRWIEPWEALRCRCFGPLFGDQSIFVRREVFEAMGGFAAVPLMEDVEFSCRLRRRGRIVLLEPAIASSARKHLQQGRWRTTLTNAVFLVLYVAGVSPERLHGWYYRQQRK